MPWFVTASRAQRSERCPGRPGERTSIHSLLEPGGELRRTFAAAAGLEAAVRAPGTNQPSLAVVGADVLLLHGQGVCPVAHLDDAVVADPVGVEPSRPAAEVV